MFFQIIIRKMTHETTQTSNNLYLTEPNTQKQLREYKEFWPNIYTNFVINFVKPGNEKLCTI